MYPCPAPSLYMPQQYQYPPMPVRRRTSIARTYISFSHFSLTPRFRYQILVWGFSHTLDTYIHTHIHTGIHTDPKHKILFVLVCVFVSLLNGICRLRFDRQMVWWEKPYHRRFYPTLSKCLLTSFSTLYSIETQRYTVYTKRLACRSSLFERFTFLSFCANLSMHGLSMHAQTCWCSLKSLLLSHNLIRIHWYRSRKISWHFVL